MWDVSATYRELKRTFVGSGMQEDDFGDMPVDVSEEHEKIMKTRNKYLDLCIEVYKKVERILKMSLFRPTNYT